MKKIYIYEDCYKLKADSEEKNRVLVGGCFDVFHYGHLFFLKEAAKKGDFLIIALESDEYIEKKKKRKPVHTQMQRAEILAALDMVQGVLLLPFFSADHNYDEMVSFLRPQIIAVTKEDANLLKKKKQAETVHAAIYEIEPLSHFSSSSIINNASFSRN